MSYYLNISDLPSAEGVVFYNMSYPLAMDFEKNFIVETHIDWYKDHWHIAFYFVFVYVMAIFGIQVSISSMKRIM